MNHKFWNDEKLTRYLIKLEHAHNLMPIYQRDGRMLALTNLLADMENWARKAQWRIQKLADQEAAWRMKQNGSMETASIGSPL